MSDAVPILRVDGVTKKFGDLVAVDDVSFDIYESGGITGLIGPNGAGKTTLFNVISSVYSPTSGDVQFKDTSIVDRPTHEIAKMGLTRTFQKTRVLERMTLKENLLVASQVSGATEARAEELLNVIDLEDRGDDLARDLSFGQQKLVSITQTLMLDPELVLLDEPFAGVNPNMENKILSVIDEFLEQDVSFFLIEHDMDIIMEHCNDIIVMDAGKQIARGAPEEIQNDDTVIEAYFGTQQ